MLLRLAKKAWDFLSFIKKNPHKRGCVERECSRKKSKKNVFNAAAKLPGILGNFY